MLSWIQDSGSTDAFNEQLAVRNEIERERRTKVSPIEDDYMFNAMYPVGKGIESENPLVGIVSDNDADRRFVVSLLLSEDIVVPGNHAVYVTGATDSVVSIAESPISLNVNASDFPNFMCVTRRTHSVLERVTVFDIRVDDKTPNSLLDQASVIYFVASTSNPDISNSTRRFLSKSRQFHDKLKLIVLGSYNSSTVVSQLMWSLAKSIHLPEMPQTYFVDQEESERVKLYSDLTRIPVGFAFNRLKLLIREARLARAHALLMSHIKSQLPAFNRQAKQDRIADELEDVIKTISIKTGVPQTDFPSAEFIRSTVRSFDFNRLKKIKESNLQLISEFIESDSQRLLAKFPEEEIALILPTPRRVEMPQPNLSEYSNIFETLNPKNGIVSGPELKEHLLSISNLPSRTLYRIWKLADEDKDGGLTLKEYSVCRELIRHVQAGKELP